MDKIGYDLNPPPIMRRMADRVKKARDFKYKKYFKDDFSVLDGLHNNFEGERVFIVATGPSLNKTDLSLLADEYVWGMNSLYNAMDRFNDTPIFWGVCDVYVFMQYYKELLDLETILFLTGNAGVEYIKNKKKYEEYQRMPFGPIVVWGNGRMNYWDKYGYDLKKGIWGGRTVMIDAGIQPAFYLGFDEIYLLGCDCDYSKGHHFDGKQHAHVQEKEGGKPLSKDIDRKRVMDSYKICRDAIEGSGKKIINCTVGGKLEVFKRKKLEDVIG